MPKLPVIRPKELAKALQLTGFLITRKTGSHLRFRHPDGRATTISIHQRTIPKGTLNAILHQTKLTAEQLRKLL